MFPNLFNTRDSLAIFLFYPPSFVLCPLRSGTAVTDINFVDSNQADCKASPLHHSVYVLFIWCNKDVVVIITIIVIRRVDPPLKVTLSDLCTRIVFTGTRHSRVPG